MCKCTPNTNQASYTLYQGDCLDILPTLEAGSVDAVITDPPYGIDFESHGQRFVHAIPISGDSDTALIEYTYNYCKYYNIPLACFFSPYKPPPVLWRSILVWSKGGHVGGGGDIKTCFKRDHESIGISFNRPLNGKRDNSVIYVPALFGQVNGHFAEKPLRLMEYLILKLTNQGDTILDPFMGSGTTGVACMKTGRNFIGIELDPDYYRIAEQRIKNTAGEFVLTDKEKATGQMALFEI